MWCAVKAVKGIGTAASFLFALQRVLILTSRWCEKDGRWLIGNIPLITSQRKGMQKEILAVFGEEPSCVRGNGVEKTVDKI